MKKKSLFLGLALVGMFVLGTVTTQFALKHNSDPLAPFKASNIITTPDDPFSCSSLLGEAGDQSGKLIKTQLTNISKDSITVNIVPANSGSARYYAAFQFNDGTISFIDSSNTVWNASALPQDQLYSKPWAQTAASNVSINIARLDKYNSTVVKKIFVGYIADGASDDSLEAIEVFRMQDSTGRNCLDTLAMGSISAQSSSSIQNEEQAHAILDKATTDIQTFVENKKDGAAKDLKMVSDALSGNPEYIEMYNKIDTILGELKSGEPLKEGTLKELGDTYIGFQAKFEGDLSLASIPSKMNEALSNIDDVIKLQSIMTKTDTANSWLLNHWPKEPVTSVVTQ